MFEILPKKVTFDQLNDVVKKRKKSLVIVLTMKNCVHCKNLKKLMKVIYGEIDRSFAMQNVKAEDLLDLVYVEGKDVEEAIANVQTIAKYDVAQVSDYTGFPSIELYNHRTNRFKRFNGLNSSVLEISNFISNFFAQNIYQLDFVFYANEIPETHYNKNKPYSLIAYLEDCSFCPEYYDIDQYEPNTIMGMNKSCLNVVKDNPSLYSKVNVISYLKMVVKHKIQFPIVHDHTTGKTYTYRAAVRFMRHLYSGQSYPKTSSRFIKEKVGIHKDKPLQRITRDVTVGKIKIELLKCSEDIKIRRIINYLIQERYVDYRKYVGYENLRGNDELILILKTELCNEESSILFIIHQIQNSLTTKKSSMISESSLNLQRNISWNTQTLENTQSSVILPKLFEDENNVSKDPIVKQTGKEVIVQDLFDEEMDRPLRENKVNVCGSEFDLMFNEMSKNPHMIESSRADLGLLSNIRTTMCTDTVKNIMESLQ